MKLLKNPWVILLAAMGGVLFGLFASREVVNAISPIGELYIHLLEMSVVPILFSAIVSSIARLARTPNVGRFFIRYISYAVAVLMFASFSAVFVGLVVRPGNLSTEQQEAIGTIIETSTYETDLGIALHAVEDDAGISEYELGWFYRFLNLLIPANIFDSLAGGRTLELVFFCIIFGVAIALLQRRQGDLLISFMSSTFVAFQHIVNLAMYPLPIGLFVLVAKQVKDTGIFSLLASLRFLLTFYGLGFIIVIISLIVISIKVRKSIFYVTRALLQCIIVSFSSRNSIATIPLGIQALREQFNRDRVITSLVVPLSITISRFGNILYFALAAVYVGQIYEITFQFTDIILIGIGAIIAGTATAGSTGFATLGMISILLVDLLGLPSEAILIVFYSIDPIIDPMRTLLITQPNLMLAVLVTPEADANNGNPEVLRQPQESLQQVGANV